MMNPTIFGRMGIVLVYDGTFHRDNALAALAAPDTSWVNLKLNGQLIIGLWTKNKEYSAHNLIEILGTTPSKQIFPYYQKSAPISSIDLAIMDALVDDPRLSLAELVKMTNLSPKTIRKHLEQLLKTKTISIVPLLGPLADNGDIIYPVIVTGRMEIKEIQKIMGEFIILRSIPEPPMTYLLCRALSLSDTITKIQALKRIDGVQSAEISLNKEVMISKNLRRSMIRERMQHLKKK